MSDESQFTRALKDKLCNDSKIYCTILEKVLSHRAFASIAEDFRQVFDAELKFALRELQRLKATTNRDLELRATLEANMHVFTENVKLVAVALVERISAGAMAQQSLEAGLDRPVRAETRIDSIAEVEEESFSDTLSKTFNVEKAFSLLDLDAQRHFAADSPKARENPQLALHRTLPEAPPPAVDAPGPHTKSAFRKKLQSRRKSPGSVDKIDYQCRSIDAQNRLQRTAREQAANGNFARGGQTGRGPDDLFSKFKAQNVVVKKKTLRNDAGEFPLAWEQEGRGQARAQREPGDGGLNVYQRDRRTETRYSPARGREKKYSTEKATRFI